MHGAVPPDVIQLFCARKAYIYFLETWGQIVASFPIAEWLDGPYLSFVDNEASKFALLKRHGKDASINNLIGTFWLDRAEHSSFPWFERVEQSDAISRGDFKEAQEERFLNGNQDGAPTWHQGSMCRTTALGARSLRKRHGFPTSYGSIWK